MISGRLKIPGLILMAISALFSPFWITALIFIAGIFLFENFYFGIFILVFMDALYGFETLKVGLFYGALSIFSILAYFLLSFIKERTLASK